MQIRLLCGAEWLQAIVEYPWGPKGPIQILGHRLDGALRVEVTNSPLSAIPAGTLVERCGSQVQSSRLEVPTLATPLTFSSFQQAKQTLLTLTRDDDPTTASGADFVVRVTMDPRGGSALASRDDSIVLCVRGIDELGWVISLSISEFVDKAGVDSLAKEQRTEYDRWRLVDARVGPPPSPVPYPEFRAAALSALVWFMIVFIFGKAGYTFFAIVALLLFPLPVISAGVLIQILYERKNRRMAAAFARRRIDQYRSLFGETN